MKKKLKLFLSLLFILNGPLAYSQVATSSSPVIPPSPNAASLGKYAEMPVSLYTGIPSISIPLYTVQQGDLKIPISLSYNSGGIKVEEVSPWVGLGWSLNAGGVVTRTVRGFADELVLGSYLNNSVTFDVLAGAYSSNPLNFMDTYLTDYESGALDTEQDSYYFNVGGMSGKFFIDKDTKKCITVPLQDVKISYTIENSKGFVRWTILAPDGTKYIFGSNLAGTRNATEANDGTFVYKGAGSGHQGGKFNSSWFLIEAISPNHQKVELFYKANVVNYVQRSSQTTYDLLATSAPVDIPPSDLTYSATNIKGVRLDRIEGSFGKVVFTPAPFDRSDLTTSDSALQYIQVYDYENVPIKKYRLATSYFTSTESLPTSPNLFSVADQLRLRLDSVIELGTENVKNAIHSFTYNQSMALPSRFSYNQDHWGFFNGKSNTSLIPPSTSGVSAFDGADRSADEASMQAFSLKRIKYPTGGTQTFNYEANNAYMQDFQNEPKLLGDSTYATVNSLNPEISGRSRSTTSAPFYLDSETSLKFYLQLNLDSATINLIQLHVGLMNLDDFSLTPLDPLQGVPRLAQTFDPGNYQLYINWKNWIPLTDTITKVDVYMAVSGRPNVIHGNPNPVAIYKNKTLGGLRIASIENDFVGQISTKYYNYSRLGDPTKSSGVLTSAPVYEYLTGLPYSQMQSGVFKSGNALFLVRTSNSNAPLATTAGGFVEYEYVRELFDQASNQGETLSHFSTSKEFADVGNFSTVFPFAPYLSQDYKRGQLLEQTSYKKEGSILYPVKKIINTYQSKAFATSPSVKMGCAARSLFIAYDPSLNMTFSTKCSSCIIAPYSIDTSFPYLATTTERNYDADTTKFIDRFTNYKYDSDLHFQLSSTSTVNSEGDTLITKLSYPIDYTISGSDAESLTIQKMKQDFRIASPIETLQLKKTVGGTTVLSASLNQYQLSIDAITTDTLVVPYKVNQTKISSPLTLSSFVPFAPSTKDPHYETRLVYNEYDSKGSLLKLTTDSSKVASYQWGYNGQYPIAAAQHAAPNEFYYNGFEQSTGSGFVTGTAHTGKKYTTNTSISWTRPNARNYVISYWRLSSGKWQLAAESAYTGSSFTLSGGSAYDDVLIKPADAQVATYAYDPLIGLTSQTDTKGLTTFYTYDKYGRLETIKDQNEDVVKHMAYNYGINVNTAANWTDTNVKTCETVGGSYTGVELMQQVDNNPYSATYNTYRTRSLGNTGNCTSTVYAKVFYENQTIALRRTKADIVVRFFSDAACTVPYSVSGLNVAYEEVDDMYNLINSSSITANGTSSLIATQAIIQENDPSGNPVTFYEFLLGSSIYYTVVY
ncbi:hypothetical protein GM921_09885 [Pedobacter sp. LMG 31464]|uniref:YD repeat-containing protein n=1 Tax=Pedobacter planticolens TaxID=2679964 RepID=A0A923IX09_9SPHI|nr:hypothetical protein [Pedobacter planticolens]MBB2145797.1 hypothetical protein [Pedobacter planticolens]